MGSRYAVLGVNCAHDASACLVVDGRVVSAVAAERITRRKHDDGFSQRAVDYCLDAAGLTATDLDMVVINQMPWKTAIEHADRNCLCDNCFPDKVINPSHHLLHAHYAFHSSPFDESAIFVTDGSGYAYGEYARGCPEHLGPPVDYDLWEAESCYLFADDRIEVIDKSWGAWKEMTERRFRFPSLGHMYSLASQYIFGTWIAAGKTMALAAYGRPNRYDFEIVEKKDGRLRVDTDWILRFKNPNRWDNPRNVEEYQDIAFKVQEELESALMYKLNWLHDKTGSKNLCMSGGVALNILANRKIMRETPFENLHVTPAATDAGTAVGAAFYAYSKVTGRPPVRLDTDFLGREYDDAEISEAIATQGLEPSESIDDPAAAAAQDIAEGRIVGWFQGRSEFGPRALGNRSILCDPRRGDMKDHLNRCVKHREPFRPFAASVLEHRVSDVFDLDRPSPYMLLVATMREGWAERAPAVLHRDMSTRIQTVSVESNLMFHRLIERFDALTGCPMVLNTSFNDRGEPIVDTPVDAIRCFLGTRMDTLVMGGHVIRKMLVPGSFDFRKTVPVLHETVRVDSLWSSSLFGLSSDRWTVRRDFKDPMWIGPQGFHILSMINGRMTAGEIADAVARTFKRASVGTMETLLDWQDRGFLYMTLAIRGRRRAVQAATLSVMS